MKLNRITSGGKFIPEIDGLRFIAIAAVVLYHQHGFVDGYLKHSVFDLGWRGVHLFFVLSGFILALPFATRYLSAGTPVSLPRYYLRRVTRLEPPYIINVLLLFLLGYIAYGKASGSHLLATLTYTHSLLFGDYSTISPVTWSLEVEIQFYLLMPLLARVYSLRTLRRPILLATIAAFSIARFFLHQYSRMDLSIVGNFQFFAAGLLLADLYTVGLPQKSSLWDLTLIGWPLIFFVPGEYTMALMPAICLPLYIGAFSGRRTSKALSFYPVTAVGGMCYSVYLWHDVFLHALRHFTGNSYIFYPAGIVLVFCTSATYFLLIERPCMKPNWYCVLFRAFGKTPTQTVIEPLR